MKLKLSYYVIVSDSINSNNDKVIFSTRTQSTLLISSTYWSYLEQSEFHLLPDDILSRLEKDKFLVPSNEEELKNIIGENKGYIDKSKSRGTLYEVIQPTAMCQLGCDYCGQKHTKDYISTSLYDRLLERVEQKVKAGDYNRLLIGWFGAEPLVGLRQMRDLTMKLKEVARKYGLQYSSKIVTNGLSLKENIFEELVNDLAVNNIEITLDGTAEYHDVHRPTKGQKGTFEIIFNNLKKILNRKDFNDFKCDVSIRCNVDERNIEGVSPLIQLLALHNMHNKISHFYPIGVYSWGGNDAHKKSLTKEEFAQREIDWFIEMLQLGYNVNLLPGRVRQVCMAVSPVSDMYDAFGNVYNCTEVSYVSTYKDTRYIAGNLKNGLENISKDRELSNWNDDILTDKFPCHTCKMLPVCGGACPKSWHEDMRACPTSKFNIKEKLALHYAVLRGIEHVYV
ncbi:MAG: radical SAM protein [Bacteroidota bacterium]